MWFSYWFTYKMYYGQVDTKVQRLRYPKVQWVVSWRINIIPLEPSHVGEPKLTIIMLCNLPNIHASIIKPNTMEAWVLNKQDPTYPPPFNFLKGFIHYSQTNSSMTRTRTHVVGILTHLSVVVFDCQQIFIESGVFCMGGGKTGDYFDPAFCCSEVMIIGK